MSFFRPELDRVAGYVPGEQPQDSGWIKLNTNENPYPPSPRVIEAIAEAARDRLNMYPDPLGTKFRKAAAEVCGIDPDWILPGNGSDEVLTILTRSFAGSNDQIAFPYPSYILYETLADLQGAPHVRLPLQPDWSWDFDKVMPIVEQSKLVFVPNPNSPSGNRWTWDDLISLTPRRGILVLDEAYGDFADYPHRGELLNSTIGNQVVITRTFSKSYSLAGIRFGFAIAHPSIISGMRKMKDSYNCDAISLAAATAAIQDQEWMLANTERIRATRERLSAEMTALGFGVVPSQTNFIWATHPTRAHKAQYDALKAQKILVRYMRFPDVYWAPGGLLDGLRITVGTDSEIDTLIAAIKEIV
jgi:histidinol-phosphate aminotransferase